MKDIKNIIIQNLSEYQKSLVKSAMINTGQSTASKAIFQILSEYQDLRKENFSLKTQLEESPKEPPKAQKEVNYSVEISDAAKETFAHIQKNPGITSDKLANMAGREERTIRDRIGILKKAGVIDVKNDGNLRKYYTNNPAMLLHDTQDSHEEILLNYKKEKGRI